MASSDTALRHHALVYDSEQDYLSVAVAFLHEGLELGQGAVVANTRPALRVMRHALGTAASSVTFVDVGQSYTRPAKALAAYHHVYAEELSRHGSLRAVADVQLGPVPGEWDLWTGYEAVFNRSFAHLPAWVLCSYRTGALPDAVREGIWRTHREVVSGGTWQDSGSYDPLDQPWRADAAGQALVDPEEIALADDLDAQRELLVRSMHRHRLPAARVLDMVLATTEVLANARAHGHGVRAIRAGRLRGRYVCDVVDNGPGFDDPLCGYLAPGPGRGSGLWVTRQLAWDLEFFRSPEGFTARVVS